MERRVFALLHFLAPAVAALAVEPTALLDSPRDLDAIDALDLGPLDLAALAAEDRGRQRARRTPVRASAGVPGR